MELITKRRMSLHAVVAADDVWLPGPLPLASAAHSLSGVGLVVQSSSLQKTAAHPPPSSSIVSCNFRYIESTDGGDGGNGFQKMPRGGLSRSLALFDLYTLHSPDWESFTSGGYSSAPSMYSGQFSPNSSSISLRPLINC